MLRQLVKADHGVWTGEVAKATDLTWNTADMVLKRLERADWLTSEREHREVAVEEARGVRRYWEFTNEGRKAAVDLLEAGHVHYQRGDTGMSLD